MTFRRLLDVPGQPGVDAVWLHTSWRALATGPFPSNGMVVFGKRRTIVIDTAWSAADSALLLTGIDRVAAPGRPKLLVVTHAHDDRMIGLPAMRMQGVASLSFRQTALDAPARGLVPPDATFTGREKRILAGAKTVTLFHPGPAHTRDNIVAFVEEDGVLFGGCMIRPAGSVALANTVDADLTAWPASARAVKARFGDRIRHVVPGHGDPGGPELVDLTIALADAAVH